MNLFWLKRALRSTLGYYFKEVAGGKTWQLISCFNKHFFIADYVSGGELFTHLYQRDHFTEPEVKIYIGEIILALEHLHKVKKGTVFLKYALLLRF